MRDYIFNVVRPTFTRIGAAFTGEPDSRLLSDPRLTRDYVPIEPGSARLFVAVRRDAVTDPARLAGGAGVRAAGRGGRPGGLLRGRWTARLVM